MKVDFSFADLSTGEHMIYIISEKALDSDVSEALEKTILKK